MPIMECKAKRHSTEETVHHEQASVPLHCTAW